MPKFENYEDLKPQVTKSEPKLPELNSVEHKKLVEEAPYHPGYEGAVFNHSISLDGVGAQLSLNLDNMDNVNTFTIPPLTTMDLSSLTISSPNWQQPEWHNAPYTWPKPTETGSALKFDTEKPPVNLLSSEALIQTAAVLKFGADKYSEHNWRKGFAWSRPLAAAMRHIMAFNDGEDCDPESGLSHLAHASCCIMFLLEFQKTHPELDDRYKVDVSKT